MAWTTPTAITPATKISDTDDIIEANAADLQAYVNGLAPYSSSTGMTANMVDKTTIQTITAQKTFTTAIVASGGVTGDLTGDSAGVHTGDVTGDVTGTADNALALGGQVVTDSVISTSITIPAALNSVKTAYDKAVSAETDAATAQTTADSKILPSAYATTTVGGTVKMRVANGVLYLRSDGVDA